MKNVLAVGTAAFAALLLAGCASSADDQAGSAPATSGAAATGQNQEALSSSGFTFAGVRTLISGCPVDDTEADYDLSDIVVTGPAEVSEEAPKDELGQPLSCMLSILPTEAGEARIEYTATERATGATEQRSILIDIEPAFEGGGVPAVEIPTMVPAGEVVEASWEDRDWQFEFGQTTARIYPHLEETNIETELKITPPQFSGGEKEFPDTGAGYTGTEEGDVREIEDGCAAVLSNWDQEESCTISEALTSPDDVAGPQFAWFTVGGNTFAASVAETAKAPAE